MSASPIVCISGGTRGLGRAMVHQLIELGATVAACGRDEQAISDLGRQFGSPHLFMVADVTNELQIDRFAAQVFDRLGAPDLLVNNAGIINRNAALWEVSASEFSQVIDVNIKGVAHMIRSFALAMVQRGHGTIVNFSSGWGRSTSPDVAPYCASKFAIEGLSQALAQELPSGMASVALNPGIINTDMLLSCFGDQAVHYPSAEQWATTAVPFLLELGPEDNGQSLTAP